MAEDQTSTEDQTTATGDDQVEGAESQTKDQTADDEVEIDEGGEGEQDVEYDDEDLRNLSDEERAAILGEEDDAGDMGSAEGEDAPQDGTESAVEANPDDGPEDGAAEEKEDEPKADDAVDISELTRAVADSTDKKRTEAFSAYEDGELTREDYLARLKAIDVEAAQEVDFTRRKLSFNAETKRYFTEAPDLLADEHIDRIDYHVRQITKDAAFDALTPRQVLELAHSRYLADAAVLGRTVPEIPGKAKPVAAKDNATTAPKKEAPKPQAKRPEPPVTLAKIPAATITSAADGKYSQLQAAVDNADAEQLERIMASMTEEEREAFASMDV